MDKNRRNLLKGAVASVAATTVAAAAEARPRLEKKVYNPGPAPASPLPFSQAVSYGNLLFVAGQGAHFEGDITAHTKFVLDEIEKILTAAGSSMEKVLKANVYLNDLKDFAAMNAVYAKRFGSEPPARTTVACAGGIVGNGLVEIDVVAYI